jgi:hypothetical protein
VSDVAIVLFAYNRPAALRRTVRSLHVALGTLAATTPNDARAPLVIAIDGPRSGTESQRTAAEVEQISRSELPNAEIRVQQRNRGLPAHLIETLDEVFSRKGISRVICVEDDVELAPTALAALLAASRMISAPAHVIGASPTHRDGSLEHQALLVSAEAHRASRALLSDYIERFHLDGAEREGAYGARDHQGIAAWSAQVAKGFNVSAPQGTSQDRIRELAWRSAGIPLIGLPVRLVTHHGLWGQHNTPWYALRTGQLWQRLDRRPWAEIQQAIRETLTP